MQQARELARLNLVLEMVAECASIDDVEGLRRLVGGRLRWILDFERCELAVKDGDSVAVWGMGGAGESLTPLAGGVESAIGGGLIAKAMSTGAPASAGRPVSSAAFPLGPSDAPLGALFVALDSSALSNRQLRLLQHIGASLGAVLARWERERAFEEHRRQAGEREQQSRRLRAASEEALAANAAKDAFLAMLGHELRNPLAPIISSATLLRAEVSGAPAARIEVIERQARHLDRLVSDLLDASRVTSGKVSLRRAPTDLRDIAAKAAEMARPGIDVRRQTLELLLPDAPAMVDGDEARLSQVLSNLLNNASTYSPSQSRIVLTVGLVGSDIVVEIADDGIGMSAATLSNAFDLFVQGARSQEIAPGGLGLGLAVARALVEAHGGHIAARSEGEGRGSILRVDLPGLDPARHMEDRTPAAAPEMSSLKPVRILLVDDNADAADSMADILRAMGHEVMVAYGPEQALARAVAFRPRVAVLDIGMPLMDGHQLADALRSKLAEPPRMIALSGFGQDRDRAKSLERGFHAHLVKPANVGELLASIAGVDSSACAPVELRSREPQ